MSEEINEVNKKIDVLMNIFAYQVVKDMTIANGAPLLRRLGMEPAQIAIIYDTTSNTVSVAISKAKKKG